MRTLPARWDGPGRDFITPAPLHYLRNHSAVPRGDLSTSTVEVTGLVKRRCGIMGAKKAAVPQAHRRALELAGVAPDDDGSCGCAKMGAKKQATAAVAKEMERPFLRRAG